ncbi:MAG: DUF1127 domain-containing protein [Ferrovibrio sp.]|uniref:DUF1127 domain-containing protein n=1 Tax=Ferrovibrio sp. TaxID=1917215 RepID=UPI00391A3C84
MSCGGTCSQSNPVILQPETAANWRLPSPSEWLVGWLVRLVGQQRRWRRREELRDLSDAQLRDVGLTREQVGGGAHPR